MIEMLGEGIYGHARTGGNGDVVEDVRNATDDRAAVHTDVVCLDVRSALMGRLLS